MEVARVKQLVKAWVVANAAHYPGLMAAHLVGSITTLPEEASFPAYKDVDFNLIFLEGSSTLEPHGLLPFSNIETIHQGLMLEGGLKSVRQYQSAEAVLANPEIAHHLMLDGTILYDPTGMLARLHGQVASEFAHPKWICARIEHERRGLKGLVDMLPMARTMGGSAEALVLGGTFSYLSAVLCVATLRPPTSGSRSVLRLREVLAECERLDLYEDVLTLWGVAEVSRARVEQLLQVGIEAFDLAMRLKRTPHFVDHKLHPHLRPYFVEACESLLHEGHHREVLFWLPLFYLAACDVIMADGNDAQKSTYAVHSAALLKEIGMDSPEARAAKWGQADALYERVFALADEIVAQRFGLVPEH